MGMANVLVFFNSTLNWTRFFAVNFKSILITKLEYFRRIRDSITARAYKAGLMRKYSLISWQQSTKAADTRSWVPTTALNYKRFVWQFNTERIISALELHLMIKNDLFLSNFEKKGISIMEGIRLLIKHWYGVISFMWCPVTLYFRPQGYCKYPHGTSRGCMQIFDE